jgi:sulfur-oxidizing protein SoxY
MRRLLLLCLLVSSAHAQDSIRWQALKGDFFKGITITEDARVQVIAPASAEDAANVPVHVRVTGIAGVTEIHVLADYNPIVKALTFYPEQAQPALGFRLKVQQTTPIRAVVKTASGEWFSGHTIVEAAGGGCTAPSLGTAAEWRSRLNVVQSKRFSNLQNAALPQASKDSNRLRFRIEHPMDTGLAPGIPAFYIEEIRIVNAQNQPVSKILSFEPISENPVFTLDFPVAVKQDNWRIVGQDNQGNKLSAVVN